MTRGFMFTEMEANVNINMLVPAIRVPAQIQTASERLVLQAQAGFWLQKPDILFQQEAV